MNEGIDGWRDRLTHGHNQQWTHERTNKKYIFHIHEYENKLSNMQGKTKVIAEDMISWERD
jgi:hypothetical protein